MYQIIHLHVTKHHLRCKLHQKGEGECQRVVLHASVRACHRRMFPFVRVDVCSIESKIPGHHRRRRRRDDFHFYCILLRMGDNCHIGECFR